MERQRQQKAELLQRTIKHIDITAHDTRALIAAYQEMSFSARDLGRACDIYERMLQDPDCIVILTVAGSTSAAGCMQVYVDMVRHNMVDVDGRDRRHDRRHGLLRGARLQALSRQPVRRRRHAARALHRPHLRHLHRRGRAAAVRPRDHRDRRRAAAAPALLARVHPRDGPLARRQPGPRAQAELARADRLRAPRADLLPGVHRQQRGLRPRRPSGGAARAPISRSIRCATSASSPSSRSRPATAAC